VKITSRTIININDGTASLILTKGHKAIIDIADVELVGNLLWCATVQPTGRMYAKRKTLGDNGRYTSLMLHRAIMRPPTGFDVDHINGNGLDCRRKNMRLATRSQNTANAKKNTGFRHSRFKGVKRERWGRWSASIKVDSTNIWLGGFSNEEDAAKSYDRAAIEHFGEFALINFPAAPTTSEDP